MLQHQLDMLFLEGAARAAGTQQHGNGHMTQHIGQIGLAGHLGIPTRQQQPRLGVATLVLVEPVPVVAHQPLGIQDVDAIAGRLRIHPLADHPRADLIRHADPTGASAVDQIVLLAQGLPLDLDRADNTGQHHGTGALNVIVE